MTSSESISRRSFLGTAAAASIAIASAKNKKLPVGLELFSVRNELKQDLMGTVRAVAKMGYDGVEFFSPYYDWTPDYARQVRTLMNDLGIKCFSTHNSPKSFSPEGMGHAIELNHILGSKIIVMASAGRVTGIDGWKTTADTLAAASEKFKTEDLRAGFHNHKFEFVAIDGKRPMDVLADNTPKYFVLQLDVGTCIEAGVDPILWINTHPGRIASIHCKDWAPEAGKGYRVLLGDGVSPWKKIMQAAEKSGGVEYYLVEQEGADTPPFETAAQCLATFKKLYKTV